MCQDRNEQTAVEPAHHDAAERSRAVSRFLAAFSVGRIGRFLFGRSQPAKIGDRGERIAQRWLKRRGFQILRKNLTLGWDEADLIVLDPDGRTLVLVEVKTRQSEQTPPEAAVNHLKQRRLIRLAARLQQMPAWRDHPIRFDVIAVVLREDGSELVRHIPAAFDSPW